MFSSPRCELIFGINLSSGYPGETKNACAGGRAPAHNNQFNFGKNEPLSSDQGRGDENCTWAIVHFEPLVRGIPK